MVVLPMSRVVPAWCRHSLWWIYPRQRLRPSPSPDVAVVPWHRAPRIPNEAGDPSWRVSPACGVGSGWRSLCVAHWLNFLATLRTPPRDVAGEVVAAVLTVAFGRSLLSGIFSAIGQLGREVQVERIRDGLAARKANGHTLGRPPNVKRISQDSSPTKEA